MYEHAIGHVRQPVQKLVDTTILFFRPPARKKRMQASLLSRALRRDVPLRSICRESLPCVRGGGRAERGRRGCFFFGFFVNSFRFCL